ncbi:MAG TPA: SRPBCC domain-containing protein [Gemmatimonadales bacterium]|jgi:uncharacterized protein YndB with AHSA1/START domain
MSEPAKTIEVKVERTIPAPPKEVFDAWLDPAVAGTPWSMSEKLILNPVVDGLFYWKTSATPHFGRFTEVTRGERLQHTWMSPNTAGLESMVTVTFAKEGNGTRMTLVHTGLPATDPGRSHEKGWGFFVGGFADAYGKGK